MARERRSPIKRDARLVRDNGFSFDNDNDLNIELSDEEKAEGFITKYLEVVDPIIVYKDFFESSAMSIQAIVKFVKNFYKELVVNGKWDEKKYVAVVNDIFENNKIISPYSFDISGKLYDAGKLSAQKRAEQRRARGRL